MGNHSAVAMGGHEGRHFARIYGCPVRREISDVEDSWPAPCHEDIDRWKS